jgi:hypothetical protein
LRRPCGHNPPGWPQLSRERQGTAPPQPSGTGTSSDAFPRTPVAHSFTFPRSVEKLPAKPRRIACDRHSGASLRSRPGHRSNNSV